MTAKAKRERLVTASFQLAIAAVVLLVWQILGSWSPKAEFLLSKPSVIWTTLIAMFGQGLLNDILITGAEALLGTLIGTVVGSSLGLALWLSKRTANISSPFIVVVSNFPIFALAPAAIVWFGVGFSLKVLLAGFATLFVSLKLAFDGAQSVSQDYTSIFEGFGASPSTIFRKAIVPGALSSVFSSMRINIGLGLLGAFIGEFLASNAGLGHVILRASGLYQMDRVFGGAICIVLLAVIFDFCGSLVESQRVWLAQWFGVPLILRKVRTNPGM